MLRRGVGGTSGSYPNARQVEVCSLEQRADLFSYLWDFNALAEQRDPDAVCRHIDHNPLQYLASHPPIDPGIAKGPTTYFHTWHIAISSSQSAEGRHRSLAIPRLLLRCDET